MTTILNIVPYIVHYIVAYIVWYTTPNASDRLILRGQECVCLVTPYPFRLEPLDEFDHIADMDITCGGDVWYARLLLFFNCTLCPTRKMAATNEHMPVSLVFFSTFEPISLNPDSCMQKKGVPMVYERAAAQVPTLYVCPVENVLGRVPLIPCYLNGNTMNSIQHKYRSKIPREAAADSRPDSGTGRRLFEVNIWTWRYGRTFPREISVEQVVELRKKRLQNSRVRSAETMRRRNDALLRKN